MSKVTPQQKIAFVTLAGRYSPPVRAIVARGGADEISIANREEAAVLDEFADGICARVLKDFPDYEGRHADINADAELVVHLVADILSEHGFDIR